MVKIANSFLFQNFTLFKIEYYSRIVLVESANVAQKASSNIERSSDSISVIHSVPLNPFFDPNIGEPE